MLTQVTERLKFLVAFRPGQLSPTLSAQMASTFQRLSGERLLLNVVTGGESAEQRAYGDFLGKDERYERTGEFLDIVASLWRGETVTRTASTPGRGREARQAPRPRTGHLLRRLLASGRPVAAKYADVYLTWGEPPAAVDAKLSWIEGLAAAENRTIGFGIRLHVIARDTADEAWRQADRLLERIDRRDDRQGPAGPGG